MLNDAQANAFAPVARGDLVSVRAELRVLLYGGVLLAASGLGLFLKENHDRLGPAAIAAVVGAAALACLAYVVRRSPPFSWEAVESPHVAVDYLLLLAMLLIAADLGYVESQFRWLGPNWTYHLLAVSILYFFAAYRFDSRAVLTLALTSFAAWRGAEVGMQFERGSQGVARMNAIGCALLYLAAGALSLKLRRKPHFEPVYVTGGLVLLFGAMLSGAWDERTGAWVAWLLAVAVAAGIVLVVAHRHRRALDFGIGVAALYLVGLRVLGETGFGQSTFFLTTGWSIAALYVLIRATRRMRMDRPA